MQYTCIALCLLAFSIHAGSGLRCFVCSATGGDRRCGDPFNRTNYHLQDCEYSRSPHIYGYNPPSNVVCLKRKQMINDQEVVTRSCEFDRDMACVPTVVHSALKDVFCQTCTEDGCNSAYSFTTSTLTAVLSAAFWAMAAKLL